MVELAYNEAKREAERLCAACGEEEAFVDSARDPLANLWEELQDVIAAQILGRAAKPRQ
ncbi:MAG: hypothetical protein Q7K03_06235 [Dehalococcoidia bacterium]|nr:hypothetical protein [Dehalococcoidia bacterium]